MGRSRDAGGVYGEHLAEQTNLASCKLRGTEVCAVPCWEVGTGTNERTWSRRRVSS